MLQFNAFLSFCITTHLYLLFYFVYTCFFIFVHLVFLYRKSTAFLSFHTQIPSLLFILPVFITHLCFNSLYLAFLFLLFLRISQLHLMFVIYISIYISLFNLPFYLLIHLLYSLVSSTIPYSKTFLPCSHFVERNLFTLYKKLSPKLF